MSELESLCRDLLKTADQVGINGRSGQRTIVKYLQNPFLPRLRALLKDDYDEPSQRLAPAGWDSPSTGSQSLAIEPVEEETGVRTVAGLAGSAATVLLAEGNGEEA